MKGSGHLKSEWLPILEAIKLSKPRKARSVGSLRNAALGKISARVGRSQNSPDGLLSFSNRLLLETNEMPSSI